MVHGASTRKASFYFVREDAYKHESPEASNNHGIRSPAEIEHSCAFGDSQCFSFTYHCGERDREGEIEAAPSFLRKSHTDTALEFVARE